MVTFTCNHCGESIKKNQVDKHLSWRCRGSTLSCMDCLKDFDGVSYRLHTNCITEDEKYSGGNFKPKESTVNNQNKRQDWMGLVVQVAGQRGDKRSKGAQDLLNYAASVASVPTKPAKFYNFVASGCGKLSQYGEEVWAILERERKVLLAKKEAETEKVTPKDSKKEEQNGSTNEATPKKKKKRKSEDPSLDEEATPKIAENGSTEDSPTKKKKKSKSKELSIDEETTPKTAEESPITKKNKKKSKSKETSIDEEITPTITENGSMADSPTKKKKKSKSSKDEEITSKITENGSVEDSPTKKKKKRKSEEPSIDDDVKVLATVTTSKPSQKLNRKQLKELQKKEKFQAEVAQIESGEVEEAAERRGKKGRGEEPGTKKDKGKKRKQNGHHVGAENGEIEVVVEGGSKKKGRKRKQAEDEDEAEIGKKAKLNDTLEEAEESQTRPGKFPWREVVIKVLEAKGGELSLKKLRRKVMSEYQALGADPADKGASVEKLEAKLTKALKKIPNVKVSHETVTLTR